MYIWLRRVCGFVGLTSILIRIGRAQSRHSAENPVLVDLTYGAP